jgi:ribose-phosphate pyrophosphokinase
VFLMQSTSTPVNDHLMELLILIDVARRASAASITAVVPYFGYARQDRKVAPRTPITARLVADLITSAGADRFVSMDLHAGQIQGFFDMPSDHLYASPVLLEHMRKAFPNPEDVVIVSPDAGGVERARAFAKRLGTTLAIVDKRRSKPNVAEVMNLIGDVRGKVGVLLDDMVDTAGTLTQGAKALLDAGARRVLAYAVHPVLSGPAIQRINESVIEQLVVTNTIPLTSAARDCKKITQLSVGRIFGEAIRRIYSADSLSSLFV